eukprot:CAMPEP_0119034480 /NCGR_PEP_ID=MMETSP1177-20130426/1468_1 /TAXON_ID=2985 /ORGANISM="Ochromonas sp, Strain CCMP1899" /LENGTH=418 /DNA_ID=CAMNT_0006991939 /DNA_START=336 /DNA_END=1592 /DNA_ORIENTATION=+
MTLYYFAFKRIGESLMGLMKTGLDQKGGGDNMHPSIKKFLAPNITLNSYELEVLNTVIDPESTDFSFRGLGGLRDIKIGLYNCVTDLISQPDGVAGGTLGAKPVAGVLLFGPPGCGKTALVHAVSKKMNIPVIRIVPSILLRKYYGETSMMTNAIFSAARKLQPCILFIDEMDALFRSRSDGDHNHDRNLLTEFMQLWDALSASSTPMPSTGDNATTTAPRILIIGATNRPQDLDAAIQRRFERSFLVGPPDERTRALVFKAILRDTETERGFDYKQCARLTDGYTPSDITALCKAAMSVIINERKRAIKKKTGATIRHNSKVMSSSKENKNSEKDTGEPDTGVSDTDVPLRPLGVMDIQEALQSVYPTAWAANSYGSLSAQQAQANAYNIAAAAANAQNKDNTSKFQPKNNDNDEED